MKVALGLMTQLLEVASECDRVKGVTLTFRGDVRQYSANQWKVEGSLIVLRDAGHTMKIFDREDLASVTLNWTLTQPQDWNSLPVAKLIETIRKSIKTNSQS